jgi:hypothetical protein
MGHGADQNLGPDDGQRRNDQTPSTDNSAGMADKRGTPVSINELITDCVNTIASFPWANGQEKRIEAHIKGDLDTCLEYHANRILQLRELDEPVTQDAKDQLKKDLLQEAPGYREYAEAIEAAKTVASVLVHEHYYGKQITELNARIGRHLQSIVEDLGENGRMSAAKLCEKLEPHFPPPEDSFFKLTPKSLCFEVACDRELHNIYGGYFELRDDPEATEKALHKELNVDQLRQTANALESILGTPLRLEYTEQERNVIKAIYEKIPWEKQKL